MLPVLTDATVWLADPQPSKISETLIGPIEFATSLPELLLGLSVFDMPWPASRLSAGHSSD